LVNTYMMIDCDIVGGYIYVIDGDIVGECIYAK